jgi:hypothetical protein
MEWVTRRNVHLDRVATPWLIKKFVDPEATFSFIQPGVDSLPELAVPFGLAGVELSSHDSDGSTFRKVTRKYQIDDRAIAHLTGIVEAGIAVSLQLAGSGDLLARFPEGVGLNAFSEGMLFSNRPDGEVIEKSSVVYDALYVYCQAKVVEHGLDAELLASPAKRFSALKQHFAST